jgi:hypothetical protein
VKARTALPAIVFAALLLPLLVRADSRGEERLARDYALAACLLHHYRGTAVAHDAERWAESLVERGSLAASAYARLDALAQSVPAGPPFSRDGKPLPLASCVAWQQGTELGKALKGFHGARPR